MTTEDKTIDWTTVEDPDELIGRPIQTRAHGLTGVIMSAMPNWGTDPENHRHACHEGLAVEDSRWHGRVRVRLDEAQYDAVYHCEQLLIYNRYRW